ncbi:B12-binding domain-containing radical SAM protein [Streptomyces sp. NBC_00448]|uniref:B12-binding domain-containing radical SAM protein n=1 Tax=Streptomyces sp. NBC_00448 TaxID=2903652 RepID=UPI002E22A1DF
MSRPQQPSSLDNGRVLLVSGLWPYDTVDEKKAVGRLNIFHNPELREGITELVGATSVYDIALRGEEDDRPLFRPSTASEPTLVSVALKSLLPEDTEVTDCELADLLHCDGSADSGLPAAARNAVCLLSTSYVTNFPDLRKVIDRLREMSAGYIVAGGYLATRNPETVLDCGADAVVVGDAEESIPALLRCLPRMDDWSGVPNLWYTTEGGGKAYTFDRMVPLDSIPVTIPGGDLSGISVPYESMRGCPYKCAFCSYPLVSTKWRFKSAEKLLADWQAIERSGAKEIIALDSTFTIPPKRLRDFLDLYHEAGLTIPWGAYSRVTPLRNEETVIQLKRANNRWLSIGFESGSQRMLDLMKKGTRLKDAYPALAHLRRHRVSPWSNFIIGYPGETEETIEATTSFMSEHIFGFYGIYVFNIRDRAMPVLSDPLANVHWEDVGSEWTHSTMDSGRATELRWRAYVRVCLANPDAINVDVFRGSNVEKEYGVWDPAFSALKHIEAWALRRIDPAAVTAEAGDDIEATERALRRRLVPLG